MEIQIVYVSQDDGIITDLVGLSDYAKAAKLAHELSAKFGRMNVTHTSIIVDRLPAFFGLVPPNEAVEHTLAGGRATQSVKSKSRRNTPAAKA